MTTGGALVLFSGGQDSTVCLAHALARHARVETVGFDYGQRHAVELVCRLNVIARLREDFPDWSARLGPDHPVDLSALGRISETALTREQAIGVAESGLPTTFVPGRNLAFLTFAAAVAWRRGLDRLVGGMCETDYSGYPDCRRATLDAMEQALSLGLDRPMAVETPLMHVDKAGAWAMAHALGGDSLVELMLEETHSCYLGDRRRRHDWGYGCGTCPACELRAGGWRAWRAGRAAAP
jgi:7-cyano-7-deazaguanine synthase